MQCAGHLVAVHLVAAHAAIAENASLHIEDAVCHLKTMQLRPASSPSHKSAVELEQRIVRPVLVGMRCIEDLFW